MPAPSSLTPTRRGLVGLVLVIGVGLSVFTWRYTARQEARNIQDAFLSRAQTQATVTTQRLRNYQEMVYSLRDTFLGQNTVTRQEFSQVAQSLLQRHAGVQALEWVKILPGQSRAELEQLATQELGQPFVVRQRHSDGSIGPATESPEYSVITYLEPLAGNESVLGYDIATAPTAPLLAASRADGEFRVSQPFRLLQTDDKNAEPGVVFILPFARAGSPVEGFVQGVFKVQTMLRQSHQLTTNDALDSYYLDSDPADTQPTLLYANLAGAEPMRTPGANVTPPPLDDPEDFHRTIEIGGRQWQLVIRKNLAWVHRVSTNQPVIILSAGLAITALLALFGNLLLQRTSRIELEVRARTSELRATEARFQDILDHSPAIIFLKDLEGRYLLCNKPFASICGRSKQEITGQRDHDLFPHADAEIYHQHDLRVLSAGQPMEFEESATTPAGIRVRIVHKFPLLDENGRAYALCGIATDITDRKAGEDQKLLLERQLLEGQKLESLGVLAGGIAHDFNNILTAILGNASLASMELPEGHIIHPQLKQIEHAARRAADLCSQMLAYAGKASFVTAPVNLTALVRDTTALLEVTVGKRIRLELHLENNLASAVGDITQLRQIVMNLVINASDSLGERTDGLITVTTFSRNLASDFFKSAVQSPALPAGHYIGLEVQDNGSGIAPEVIPRIFEPFFTTKFSGRGLGLAAVLGIIQSHDGALFVESTLGQGTAFRIFLPASKISADPSQAPFGTAAAPMPLKGTVLLVDDEQAVRQVATRALASIGLKTIPAADGQTAIDLFRVQPGTIDLVLLDLTMPGLTGEETFRQLQQINPAVRIIIMSGFSESETMQRCASLGAVGFLPKPFEIAALISRLRPHLG